MSTFLFYMGHPAHYHNVKCVADTLAKKGHKIIFVARQKDVLFDLLKNVGYKTYFLKERKSNAKLGLIWAVFKREFQLSAIVLKHRVKILIGTDVAITHVGKVLRKKSIVLNEDDAIEVPFLAKLGIKFSTCTLSPNSCNISPYNHKKIGYNGYHELAYLHPDQFKPNKSNIQNLKPDEPYFLLRFAQLTAHHDEGKKGIDNELALQIIDKLKGHGNVYISSERPLDAALEPYRIKIEAKHMHHALSYAKIYIGDSQTMAAEAAVLGTPSIRFNDFVGKLGYLEELEHKFGLTYGIKTSDKALLLQKIEDLLKITDLKKDSFEKRKEMLSVCVNVHDLWVDTFHNFPQSWLDYQKRN